MRRRTTIRVKEIGSSRKRGRSKTYAVYIAYPSGVEYRMPNTDFKKKSDAVKKAREIRKQRRMRKRRS